VSGKMSTLDPPAANVSYRGAPSGFLLDRLATLSIKLTWSSRFFGKPIRGIPAPNASVAVRAKIFSEIDRRQGGDVTLSSI
jgi:hypothetical protein